MTDPSSVPTAARSSTIVACLVTAAVGGAAMIAGAFLPWFTATAQLPRLPGFPSEIRAEVSGLGAVTVPRINGADIASSVPTDAAWAGGTVLTLAAGAIALAAGAAFLRRALSRAAGWAAVALGLAAAGIGLYAQVVPVGTQAVQIPGGTVDVVTAAHLGPYVVIAGAAVLLAGTGALLTIRRPPGPRIVRPPVAQPSLAQPSLVRPPLARPPLARPSASPPRQAGPSEQRTTVVRRPPRPTRMPSTPETGTRDRSQGPTFDGPTQPL